MKKLIDMADQRKQQGFTLVELAIVLVIIGLLIGGVLKGSELIQGAKVKAAAKEPDELRAAYFGYLDRYNKKPGDDNTQANRWADLTAGNNNGLIEGGACDAINDESCYAVRALRHAGFLKGDGKEELPRVPGTFSELTMYTAEYDNRNGVWLQTYNTVAKEDLPLLDSKLDDGKCNSGVMVSINVGNTTECNAAGEYVTDQIYLVKLD